MADKVWNGSSDNSFNTAANWTASGVPADGDSLFFVDDVSNGCTADCDQNAKNFLKVVVSPSYKLDVGASGDYLQCGVDVVSMEGVGTMYFKADDGSAGSDWLDKFIQFNGTVYLDTTPVAAQTVALLRVFKGRCFVQTGGKYTDIEILSLGGVGDAVVDIDANITDDSTTITQASGLCALSSGVSTVNVDAGIFTLRDSAAITTLGLKGGGFNYDSSGTITTANIYGGSLTAAGNEETSATITTANGFGGTLDLRNKRGTVTATTVNINGQSFTLRVDTNKAITIADQ